MVEAREHHQLDDLRRRELRLERAPTSTTRSGARSCSASQSARIARSRGPKPESAGSSRRQVARTSAAERPAREANTATCTPHSYSEPQRAQVRRIASSRSRRPMLPRSSNPPARKRDKTRGLCASVRNSRSGSAPGGVSFASAASSSAPNGGAAGAILGSSIVGSSMGSSLHLLQ